MWRQLCPNKAAAVDARCGEVQPLALFGSDILGEAAMRLQDMERRFKQNRSPDGQWVTPHVSW